MSVIAAKPNLEVEREVAPDRVSAGEEAEVVLDVRNAGKWRSVSARAVDVYGGGTQETRRVAVPWRACAPANPPARDTRSPPSGAA
ncbi:hypothetical protein GCM10029992_66450 [Glycomyces albus]